MIPIHFVGDFCVRVRRVLRREVRETGNFRYGKVGDARAIDSYDTFASQTIS